MEWKGGVLLGECKRQSNCFHALYHIFKLSQFIIGFFGCILIPGTLKLNWLQVFSRFTLWLPQIRQPHDLLKMPKKKIQVKTLCHAEFKSKKGSNKTIIQGSLPLKLFNLLEYQFPLLKPMWFFHTI